MARLDGHLAVITGGSRGIGLAIGTAFAEEGARVVLASRKQEGLDRAAAEIQEAVPGAEVHPRALHVGRVDAIAEWWDRLQADLGIATVLVNNAGTNPYFGPMLGVEWAAWDKTFEVNLKGPFEMTRAFVQRRLATGSEPGGSVIFMSSILGQGAAVLQGVYGMTKASMISMAQTLSHELGATGMRFNCIAPGVIDTRLSAALTGDEELSAQIVGRTALGRIGQPTEIAGIAVFLASGESAYVTGQTFTVDGGLRAG